MTYDKRTPKPPPTARRISLTDLRNELGKLAREIAASDGPIIVTEWGKDLVQIWTARYAPDDEHGEPLDLNPAQARRRESHVVCSVCGATATAVGDTDELAADLADTATNHTTPEHIARLAAA